MISYYLIESIGLCIHIFNCFPGTKCAHSRQSASVSWLKDLFQAMLMAVKIVLGKLHFSQMITSQKECIFLPDWDGNPIFVSDCTGDNRFYNVDLCIGGLLGCKWEKNSCKMWVKQDWAKGEMKLYDSCDRDLNQPYLWLCSLEALHFSQIKIRESGLLPLYRAA